jgi:hypothetical protein
MAPVAAPAPMRGVAPGTSARRRIPTSIEQGMSVKRAQTILGHSTTAMTLDVYGHWYPAPEDDQAPMRELQ